MKKKTLTEPSCADSKGAEATNPYVIGTNYFIRTVTHHYTGELVNVYEHELVLKNAAWIPDDGRFTQAVEKGEFLEAEPYPAERLVIINRGALLDVSEIPVLPRSQK